MLHIGHYPFRHGARILLLASTIYIPLVTSDGSDTVPPPGNLRTAVVQVTETSSWRPASPDPSGISYWSSNDRLVVVDGEVDEMPRLFNGDNLYIADRNGSLLETSSTISFSREPTSVAAAARQDREYFYITDDNNQRVYAIDLGSDRRYGTNDDRMSSFSTLAFGCADPEGIAYGGGKLFIADGVGSEVFVVDPGPNSRFDGVAPEGDDVVTHFDTGVLKQPDPEAIDYLPDRGSLLLTSRKTGWDIAEVNLAGKLLQVYELSHAGIIGAGDLALAPASAEPTQMNIYIVDRGIDNNTDPNENDGKIYEISLVEGENLLQNPGFEQDADDDGQPDGWSASGPFTRSNQQPRSGSYEAKLGPGSDQYSIHQTVGTIVPEEPYFFFGWLDVASLSGSARLRLELRWLDRSNSIISTRTFRTFTSPTNGWSLETYSEVAPPGAEQAQLRLTVSGSTTIVYIDDFDFGP